jgi:hypothetical protein
MTKKVTIEITEDGWQTTLELNGKTYTEKHKRNSTGAESVKGNLSEESDLTEEIIDAVTGGFKEYEIMRALYNDN